MSYINEIPEGEHRERIRREILDQVSQKAKEANDAFAEFSKLSGLVYSGGTIALLSYIGTRKEEVPALAIVGFGLLVLSLLTFIFFSYRHSQLHARRYANFSDIAQRFFLRESTIEDVLMALRAHQSATLYRAIFWIPFSLAALGLASGGLAALGVRLAAPSQNPPSPPTKATSAKICPSLQYGEVETIYTTRDCHSGASVWLVSCYIPAHLA